MRVPPRAWERFPRSYPDAAVFDEAVPAVDDEFFDDELFDDESFEPDPFDDEPFDDASFEPDPFDDFSVEPDLSALVAELPCACCVASRLSVR